MSKLSIAVVTTCLEGYTGWFWEDLGVGGWAESLLWRRWEGWGDGEGEFSTNWRDRKGPIIRSMRVRSLAHFQNDPRTFHNQPWLNCNRLSDLITNHPDNARIALKDQSKISIQAADAFDTMRHPTNHLHSYWTLQTYDNREKPKAKSTKSHWIASHWPMHCAFSFCCIYYFFFTYFLFVSQLDCMHGAARWHMVCATHWDRLNAMHTTTITTTTMTYTSDECRTETVW